jgi:hypothetical protein
MKKIQILFFTLLVCLFAVDLYAQEQGKISGKVLSTLNIPVEGAVRVFPNPVKDKLYINNLPADHLPFIILDLRGKQMINGQHQNGQSIHVSALPAGVYMIKVGDWRGKFVKK